MDSLKRLAEIACGEKTIVPVAPVKQKNVDVAVKLAVLEAIVKQMGLRFVLAFRWAFLAFGQLPRFEPLSRNIDPVSYTHLDVYKRQLLP